MPPPSSRSLVCNVYEELKVCTSLLLCHSQGVKAAKSGRDWASSIKLSVYLCVSVCATCSEWTITKNLLNSRCSPSATICLSSISSFHSQMQRYGAFRVSVSNLTNSPPAPRHFVRLKRWGVLSQLSPPRRPRMSLIPPDDGGVYTAAEINALHLHFLSHFCLTSRVSDGADNLRKQYLSYRSIAGEDGWIRNVRKSLFKGRLVRKFKVDFSDSPLPSCRGVKIWLVWLVVVISSCP